MRAGARPPMRVAYVVDTSAFGGAEVYLQQLLRASRGVVEPSLLAARPGVAALENGARALGVPVESFSRIDRKLDVGRLYALARAISRRRPDLVHVNMTTATNNRYAIAAALLARVPTVATVHSPVAVGTPRHTFFLRGLFARLRAVIAVSRAVHKVVVEDLRVPPAHVHLIANGVADAEPLSTPPGSRARIVALGRLEREKGFDVLIAATRMLAERAIPVEVVICGEGRERRALEEASRDLPVTLPGFVADAAQRWQGAHVFCLPSRLEGLPLSLLEAMTRALPCVASDVGDVGEALGAAGKTVPPDDPRALADAIASVVADPDRAAAMGAAARARALAHHSVDAMIERTIDLYAACLHGC